MARSGRCRSDVLCPLLSQKRCAEMLLTPHSGRFAAGLQKAAARTSLVLRNWRRGWIRTHGTVTRTTVFEFYDSHVGLCRSVAKRGLLFAISKPMILACCRA